MALPTIIKRGSLMIAVAGALLLGGCNEKERAAERAHEAQLAGIAAEASRRAQEYAARLAAQTQRMANELAAETARVANQAIEETKRQRAEIIAAVAEVLGIIALVAATLGGVIAWVVYNLRRLGEHRQSERTKRHDRLVLAIESDPNIPPDERAALYETAIEASHRPAPPLIGYMPGGAA